MALQPYNMWMVILMSFCFGCLRCFCVWMTCCEDIKSSETILTSNLRISLVATLRPVECFERVPTGKPWKAWIWKVQRRASRHAITNSQGFVMPHANFSRMSLLALLWVWRRPQELRPWLRNLAATVGNLESMRFYEYLPLASGEVSEWKVRSACLKMLTYISY